MASVAIDQAVQAAQAAGQARTELANAPVTSATVQNLPTATPGPRLTMGDMQGSSLTVDAWIKMKEYGIGIGDSSQLIPSLVVSIDMTDGRGFIPKKAVRYGNPAVYAYSLDGITALNGGAWDTKLQIAAASGKSSGEYRSVDLPFRLEEDAEVISNPKTKEVTTLAAAGKMLGYTTPVTGWKNWEDFYRQVAEKGWLGQRVKVCLTAQRRVNKAGNAWGVMAFELLDLVEEEGEE